MELLSLCKTLQPPVTSSVFDPNILLITLNTNTKITGTICAKDIVCTVKGAHVPWLLIVKSLVEAQVSIHVSFSFCAILFIAITYLCIFITPTIHVLPLH
jgi:hypothetical protein